MKVMPVNGSEHKKTQTAVPVPPPAPEGNASEKVLWGKDEAVKRLGGDEELFRELCEIFLQESPKLLQKLREAIGEPMRRR